MTAKTPRLQDGLRPNARARLPGSARGYLPAASPPSRGRLSQRPFAPTGPGTLELQTFTDYTIDRCGSRA
jgi:hypothetical protein